MINNEEEIVKRIKNKNLNEIKEIFKDNNIKIEQFNDLKNVVLYLIE